MKPGVLSYLLKSTQENVLGSAIAGIANSAASITAPTDSSISSCSLFILVMIHLLIFLRFDTSGHRHFRLEEATCWFRLGYQLGCRFSVEEHCQVAQAMPAPYRKATTGRLISNLKQGIPSEYRRDSDCFVGHCGIILSALKLQASDY